MQSKAKQAQEGKFVENRNPNVFQTGCISHYCLFGQNRTAAPSMAWMSRGGGTVITQHWTLRVTLLQNHSPESQGRGSFKVTMSLAALMGAA